MICSTSPEPQFYTVPYVCRIKGVERLKEELTWVDRFSRRWNRQTLASGTVDEGLEEFFLSDPPPSLVAAAATQYICRVCKIVFPDVE